MPSVADNLARVEDSIAEACRRANRPRSEVKLMAVSKTHPVEFLLEAAAAGHLLFGENRVQEFAGKTSELSSRGYAVELHATDHSHAPASLTPDAPGLAQAARAGIEVNLIGHLQSNKALRAVELFTGIDTLDSRRLAERLNEAALKTGRVVPVLLEIKISHEPSKEGLAPDSPELLALLERLPDLTALAARGLMTVAPIDDDPEVARDCFRTLQQLRETLARRHPRLSFDELSMGMSGDFAAAIEAGSTLVRIGTAIFGARPKPAQG